MHESPRLRRLRNDLAALERLRDESSVLRFRASGRPAQQYLIEFRGKSLARHRDRGKVTIADHHQVEIKLGASYPRTMPEIRWLTPIYHPNISEIGLVCLGGYGTHWVPSLNLDELVGMLWDMARYHNYDVRSPYNRDAALWVANQAVFTFPVDARPLRDLRARLGRVDALPPAQPTAPRSFLGGLRQRLTAFGRVDGTPSAANDPAIHIEIEPPAALLDPPEAPSEAPVAVSSVEDGRPAPVAPGADATASVPVIEPDEGLIILEPVERTSPSLPDPERPIRLRAQDEEIVFID
jgi:ubiquitin-protein ligase